MLSPATYWPWRGFISVAINTSRCSIRLRSTLHGVERVEVADDCVVTYVPVLSLNTDMKLLMVSRVAPPPLVLMLITRLPQARMPHLEQVSVILKSQLRQAPYNLATLLFDVRLEHVKESNILPHLSTFIPTPASSWTWFTPEALVNY